MKKRNALLPVVLAGAAAALFPVNALAHVGHGTSGGTAGLVHPLAGLDHLLAMMAVGIWGAQLGRRAMWRLPLTFVGCMVLGGMLARVRLPAQLAEAGILLSVLVLGTLVALSSRAPLAVAAAVVGAFALCHGYAHGVEIRAEFSPLSYGVGFVASTAALHATGLLMCVVLRRTDGGTRIVRLGGVCTVACGGMMLAGVL